MTGRCGPSKMSSKHMFDVSDKRPHMRAAEIPLPYSSPTGKCRWSNDRRRACIKQQSRCSRLPAARVQRSCRVIHHLEPKPPPVALPWVTLLCAPLTPPMPLPAHAAPARTIHTSAGEGPTHTDDATTLTPHRRGGCQQPSHQQPPDLASSRPPAPCCHRHTGPPGKGGLGRMRGRAVPGVGPFPQQCAPPVGVQDRCGLSRDQY